MHNFDMSDQLTLPRIAFVTFITLESDILMYAFDMPIQMSLQREAFVTLVTLIFNIAMSSHYMLPQI